MTQRNPWKAALLITAFCGLVSFHTMAADPPPPVAERPEHFATSGGDFMHAKLEATHQIVDGLAFEDFDRITNGAEELLSLGDQASWKVRRDPLYMHYAADFESTALRLRDAARKHSIESATFAYVHLTVSCTACHNHVRNVVQLAPRTGNNVRFIPAGRVRR